MFAVDIQIVHIKYIIRKIVNLGVNNNKTPENPRVVSTKKVLTKHYKLILLSLPVRCLFGIDILLVRLRLRHSAVKPLRVRTYVRERCGRQ